MNYYQILGVPETASKKEIKDAYKKLIKKYHPDIYDGDKSFAEKKTQEINLAYDTLSNDKVKQAYDEELHPPQTYSYTPPKYYNPESYSYGDYYKSKSYNNYYDYSYRKAQTSYNQNSTQNYHEQFSDNIINTFSKFSLKKKLIIFFAIFIIYIMFFIYAIFQLNFFYNHDDVKINTPITTVVPSSSENQENSTYNESNNDSKSNSKNNPINDFDINDYLTEEELHEIYNEYKDNFDSYESFKETISYYLYYYYYSQY